MYGFDFKSKIARLNPHLFVDDSSRRHVSGDWFTAGLFSRKAQRSNLLVGSATHYLDPETRRYAEASDAGNLADFVCGVPQGWVPEEDVRDPESGRLLARGWRSILLYLVKKNLVDFDRARRVFGCSSLGDPRRA